MDKCISVIGAPVWLGQSRYGTNLAPDAIRSAGIIGRLEAAGLDVIDEGNIPVSAAGRSRTVNCNMKNSRSVAQSAANLAAAVSSVLAAGRFPLVLGGDHSVAIGSIAGAANHAKELGVIWFDAHADINTPDTSPSGNIHGMPLAVSLGLGRPELTDIGGKRGKIKSENLVYLGVRDIDSGEAARIRELGIRVYSPAEIRLRGVNTIIQEALSDLSSRCDAIHLSFDIDGIDPIEAPGVGTPVHAGVNFADSLHMLTLLSASRRITSAEFVELNPILDKDRRTLDATLVLISAFLAAENGALTQKAIPTVSAEAL